MNEETRKMVLSMTLMSDILFNAVMNNNKECMEYILKIIMDKADLQVHRVEVQHTYRTLFPEVCAMMYSPQTNKAMNMILRYSRQIVVQFQSVADITAV